MFTSKWYAYVQLMQNNNPSNGRTVAATMNCCILIGICTFSFFLGFIVCKQMNKRYMQYLEAVLLPSSAAVLILWLYFKTHSITYSIFWLCPIKKSQNETYLKIINFYYLLGCMKVIVRCAVLDGSVWFEASISDSCISFVTLHFLFSISWKDEIRINKRHTSVF